jgi:hypothetical protein
MKQIKLYLSVLCLFVVVGLGVALTYVPSSAQARPPQCHCKENGTYHFERQDIGCVYICD